MFWNWQLPEWPNFTYNKESIRGIERDFLIAAGGSIAYLKTVDRDEYSRFIVEILSIEGAESSKIEGEFLDRESLQSSIKRNFGLKTEPKRSSPKETGMAQLLTSVYESFDEPLTHEVLWKWHAMLFPEGSSINDMGKYRTHSEPMQIVSNRMDNVHVFFEAPPSTCVHEEMTRFIDWFNCESKESILAKAAIAHVYFESIHPFEDGNGRIGRVLSEKILSQGIKRPILIAISKTLEKRKKEYYANLERCNRTVAISSWVDFFSSIIVTAHKESMNLLYFIIEKSKMLSRLSDQLNDRQTKVLLRLFEEGPEGFKGGLSAQNYLSITKTARANATRDLSDLVEKGALKRTGELRHTRYWLNIKRA
jgi:Fic family protein